MAIFNCYVSSPEGTIILPLLDGNRTMSCHCDMSAKEKHAPGDERWVSNIPALFGYVWICF